MKRIHPITTLFVDVGGVLLTNGWDHAARRRAATAFKLEWAEMEARHRLTFETYEDGKLTLEEYLDLVVFHVQIAEGLGIHGILHKDYASTSTKLVSLGLGFDNGAIRGAR